MSIHDHLAKAALGLSNFFYRMVTPRRRAAHLASLVSWQSMGYKDSGLVQRVAGPGEMGRVRGWRKEPDTVEWIEKEVKPGDVFFDVGANVGSYGLIAHAVGGGKVDVVAFEPNPPTFASLAANLHHNGVKGMALPIALGESRGTLWLDGELNLAGKTSTTHLNKGIPVLCERLDDLISERGLPTPTVMKIDIDGAEGMALRGMEKLLTAGPLRSILIEMDKEGPGADEVKEVLSRAGWVESSRARRISDKLVNAIFVRKEERAP